MGGSARKIKEESMGQSTDRWGRILRYGGPGVLAGLALSWAGGWRAPSAQAQAQFQPGSGVNPAAARPEANSNGTIAFTTTTPGATQLLYLIDTRAQAFAIYKVDPQKGAIKLEAARPYRWDLKLEYNNLPPTAHEVESMLSTPPASPSPRR